MAVAVKVATVDKIDYVLRGSLRVTTTNGDRPGRCDFTTIDYLVGIGFAIEVSDGATVYFSGVCMSSIASDKDGRMEVQVTAFDDGAVPTEATAPFMLSGSDVDGDTVYQHFFDSMGITGPLRWWRLGEASGTTAADEMGVTDGTYVDTPTLGVASAMESTTDTAVTFNGSSQYVTCGASAIISGYTDLTISAMFKTATKAAVQAIYTERDESSTASLLRLVIDTNGRPAFQHRGLTGAISDFAPTTGDWADGAWHHVVATMTGTAIKIYVDGALVRSATKVSQDTTDVDNVRIGHDVQTGAIFAGSLDEVILWSRAISAQTVNALHQMHVMRPYLTLEETRYRDTTTGEDPITAVATTLYGGLEAGQHMAYVSTKVTDGHIRSTIIQEVEIVWLNATTPRWRITTGVESETSQITVAPLHFAKTLLGLP